MSGKDPRAPFERADEFLALFRRGAEFTRELLAENERLRTRLFQLERRHSDAAQDTTEWEKLRQELAQRIDGLEAERENVLEELRSIEEENRQFVGRFVEIEEENNNLANLYVSSFQLHSTLDFSETLKVIIEIVINLIGAEVFAVYVRDERSGWLEPVAAEGEDPAAFPRLPAGEGVVGRSLESGETVCSAEGSSGDYAQPIVCIPLRVFERQVGAIAIFGLLQQKTGFTALDHELFSLLAGHAATALFASQLYGESERKLSTIQGFIELLTN